MMTKFTKIIAKTKFASLVFLLIVSLQVLQIAKVSAQASTQQRVANTVKITNVEAINESRIGLIDGKIIVTVEDLNTQLSTYRLSYDLHSVGNNFVSPVLKSVNNKLILSNVRLGNYYNLKIIRNNDNIVSAPFGAFKVDNAPYVEGASSSNRTATLCGSTINYSDCAGVAKSISNCYTGSGYNDANNYRPCGVQIASECTVFAINQWHCIDGNLSTPPNHNEFTPTDYVGAGLTALQAARINWIVCNHACFDAGVDQAIWFTAGTGGSNNAIAQAAATAVPVANGTQSLMIFYKSLNGSYQDMVQWQCRTTTDCSCPNNLVTNPSFENGTNGWSWSGGNFNAGTGAIFCGNYSGDFQITNNANNWVSQNIGTDLIAGTVINASVYAGTHDNSVNHYVSISFFDASWNYISAASVSVTVNKVLATAPAGPQLYNMTATVPANAKYTQVGYGGSGGWIKTDNWCVTASVPCTGRVTGLYFNKLDGGTDLPISNGAIFTPAQLGFLYNLETSNTGTTGSIKFTITGPTPTSNIENTAPYNSPATGAGAWTGAEGTYYVNMKTYSATGATGAICHDTTISFILTSATASIGDRVWGDANGNGIQDAGETTGFTGVTVQLKNAAGTVIATTSTNATGYYLFSGLAAGNYTVVFPTAIGTDAVTSANVGADDNIDSDASQATGETGIITLAIGQNITDVDAGYCPTTLQLGNRVWNDVNNDGLNGGEAGISGVVVNLYKDNDNNNVADGALIATTTTDANGYYLFSSLVPGNYIVGVVTPSGFTSSSVNGGDPDNDINLDDNGQITVGTETRGLSITLTGGAEPDGTNTNTNTNITYDFGFYATPTGSIGDRVWYDANGNGIQDATETTGITGVTVELRNAAGNVIATTTTNATGNYLFSGLAAGNYSIVFPPSINGAVVTTANVGADDNIDSDADQTTGATGTITLGVGQNITNVDAGYCPINLSLGDRVYYDLNNNGVREAATEAGIPSVTVNLYKDNNNDNIPDAAAIATTTTDANGGYRFDNLVPGNYIVGVTPPATYTSSTNAAIDPDNDVDLDDNGTNLVGAEWRGLAITLTGGGEPLETGNFNNTYDFGFFQQPGSIGNFVWNDTNGNGVQDAGEAGIAGVTVNLLNAAGTVIATTTTDANGAYNFPNVTPGTYSVTFTTPAGYTATGSNLGGNDNTDSDPIGGTVTGVVVTAGTANNTVDAGFFLPAALGNFVWNDVNANGVQDATEVGINAVTVNLLNAAGTVIGTTTTSATGAYSFTNLAPGTYGVSFVTPAGYTASPSNVTIAGATDANDSDPVAGTVTGITLTSGQTNNTIDAGFYQPGSIGNFVWNDTNGNGVQDAGEAGISGVTVNLLNAAGTVIATTTTNASGIYNFTNLVPGTYGVAFITPAGYTNASAPNLGGNDATDSDPIAGVVTGIVIAAGQTDNSIDAGFYNCLPITSGINGPLTICAAEAALFTATGAGSGSVYTWAFMSGSPATATGNSATSSWSTVGEYDITLTVTKNGCSASYTRSIVITQSVFAGAGPDADICSGSSTTLSGTGPVGSNYSWTVVSGDPTSIDNGANQQSALVSPLVTTVYQLTVTQNGCTRTDQVTVFINVNKNPTANAGANKVTFINVPVAIGGSPTGTPPLATPGAALGYIWSAATGLNSNTIANPTVTLATPGVYNYQVIVYSILTGCSDTATVSVNVLQPLNLGDRVWYDKNNNGTQDATEPGVVGVTVNLYADADANNVPDGAAVATTTTIANGIYNFPALLAGNYIVGAVIPTGYTATTTTATSASPNNDNNTDNNGVATVAGELRTNFITLSVDGEPSTDGDGINGNLTADLGITGTAALGNFVWEDLNRNGLQDAGEPGIAGATVTLTYPDATTATTTTNGTGNYSFTGLLPGTYSVAFTTPTGGYAVSASNVGTNDAIDSDPVSGVVSNIILTNNQIDNTIDAGFYKILSLTGNVWHDVNGMTDNLVNNTAPLQSPTPGAPIPTGLRISRVDATTGLVVSSVLVTGSGTFNFPNVAPGNYILVLSTTPGVAGQLPPFASLPTGWINTGEKLGITSGRDPIVNGKLSVSVTTTNVINANFGIQLSNEDIGIN